MKTILAPLLSMAAFCLLPAYAITATPPKPPTPLEEAKSNADNIDQAMKGIAMAIEQVKDEKTAKEAAGSIIASSKKIQELDKSRRSLHGKLKENDKKEMAKTMEQMNLAQYNERFTKAIKGMADKPALLEILKPAQTAFDSANSVVTAEIKDRGRPMRLIEKGGRVAIPN